MSIQLASTTDTEAQVREALEASGQQVESVEVFSNEGETVTTDTPATAESLGTTPESDPPDEIDDGSDPSEQERDEQGKPKPKGGRGFQKRISKLESHISERDQKIAELEQSLKQVREAQQKPEEVKPEPAAAAPPKVEAEPAPKPKLEDFESYEEFTDALTDWKLEKKELKLQEELNKLRAELSQKDEDNQAAVAQEQANAAWNEKVEAVKADYPDWDEVASQTADDKVAPISAAMANAIWEGDENGPRVLHYLASHPDEAKRIFELTNHKPDASAAEIIRANRAVGREYARIEALVAKPATKPATETPSTPETQTPAATPPAKPKPKASTAPPPITPTKTATAQATPDTPLDRPMSHKEYMEWWNRTHKKAA